MKAKKGKADPVGDLIALAERLRAVGVLIYEGPVPGYDWDASEDGPGSKQHVKLRLSAPVPAPLQAAAPAKVDDKPTEQSVPRELSGIGVTPDVMADALERARQLNPGS